MSIAHASSPAEVDADRVAIEVARANAAWTEGSYVLHFDRCRSKDERHCQRCEDLLMNAIAAERHLNRLTAALLNGEG